MSAYFSIPLWQGVGFLYEIMLKTIIGLASEEVTAQSS